MKFLQILVLIFGLVILVNAQANDKAILSGTVYDVSGSLISDAKITAINQEGQKFETLTNTEGVYVLNLLFAKPRFKTIKYEITIDETKRGFEKFVLKNFNFIQSTNGKMQLDFALDSLNPEPCGYSGGDCINNTQTPLKLEKTKVSTKILQTPLEKLPKKQIKTKRKIINNKQ